MSERVMSKDEVEQELLDRTRRIETRLMSLGNRLGFNLKDEEGVHVNAATLTVDLDSMDVSVSAVILIARRAGLHGKKVTVVHRNEVVATNFKV
ncbi:MAG TPA: hypothetical protein VF077_10315 [Nitrospiraceae bacterium]